MFTPDDLAGIVDLFGALTRPELEEALSELAYRQDTEVPEEAVSDALEAFALVSFEPARDDVEHDLEGGGDADHDLDGGADDVELLTPGPSAFPTLPDGAEDLPHILDVDHRPVDREVVGRAAEERLRTDAARAVADGDVERAAELLDVSYDVETWAPVDLTDVRERLDDARTTDDGGS